MNVENESKILYTYDFDKNSKHIERRRRNKSKYGGLYVIISQFDK